MREVVRVNVTLDVANVIPVLRVQIETGIGEDTLDLRELGEVFIGQGSFGSIQDLLTPFIQAFFATCFEEGCDLLLDRCLLFFGQASDVFCIGLVFHLDYSWFDG